MSKEEAPLAKSELDAKIFKLERYMGLLEGKIRKRERDVQQIKTKQLDDQKMVDLGVRLIDPTRGRGIES